MFSKDDKKRIVQLIFCALFFGVVYQNYASKRRPTLAENAICIISGMLGFKSLAVAGLFVFILNIYYYTYTSTSPSTNTSFFGSGAVGGVLSPLLDLAARRSAGGEEKKSSHFLYNILKRVKEYCTSTSTPTSATGTDTDDIPSEATFESVHAAIYPGDEDPYLSESDSPSSIVNIGAPSTEQ